MTKECCWCNFTNEEKQSILFESIYWYVFLADNQDYIGRCVIVFKRHCINLSDLDLSEWIELKELINRLERCFEKILGADLFHCFLCNTDCDKEKVKLQQGETISFKWIGESEFIEFVNSDKMIDRQKAQYLNWLKEKGYLNF